jgi:hypothetical protein
VELGIESAFDDDLQIGDFSSMTSKPQASSRRKFWIILVVAVMAVAPVSGGLYFIYAMTHVTIDGTLNATGPTIGTWTLTPDICQSGFARAFYGVQMFMSRDKELGFVYSEDPSRGPHVTVSIPNTSQGYGFNSVDCPVMHASLWRGPMINYVRAIGGTIDLDCSAEGNNLNGHLAFENCH